MRYDVRPSLTNSLHTVVCLTLMLLVAGAAFGVANAADPSVSIIDVTTKYSDDGQYLEISGKVQVGGMNVSQYSDAVYEVVLYAESLELGGAYPTTKYYGLNRSTYDYMFDGGAPLSDEDEYGRDCMVTHLGTLAYPRKQASEAVEFSGSVPLDRTSSEVRLHANLEVGFGFSSNWPAELHYHGVLFLPVSSSTNDPGGTPPSGNTSSGGNAGDSRAQGGSSQDTNPPPLSQPPVAKLTASASTAAVLSTITFDATGSTDPDGYVAKFNWTLPGSVSYNLLEAGIMEVTFEKPGTFTIDVAVEDDLGASTSASSTVSIGDNLPPIAVLTATRTNAVPSSIIVFVASDSSDPEGGSLSYSWTIPSQCNFELTSKNEVAQVTFDTPGTYAIKVAVKDDQGAVAEASRTVTIQENQPPQAVLIASPKTATAPCTIRFDATTSTDVDGTIARYEFLHLDEGKGTPVSPGIQDIAFEYAGTYEVIVCVYDDLDAYSLTKASVTIDGALPTVWSDTSPSETLVNEVPIAQIIVKTVGGVQPIAPVYISIDTSGSHDPDGQIRHMEVSCAVMVDGVMRTFTNNRKFGWTANDLTSLFENPGTYTFSVRVFDDKDAEGWADVTFTLH